MSALRRPPVESFQRAGRRFGLSRAYPLSRRCDKRRACATPPNPKRRRPPPHPKSRPLRDRRGRGRDAARPLVPPPFPRPAAVPPQQDRAQGRGAGGWQAGRRLDPARGSARRVRVPPLRLPAAPAPGETRRRPGGRRGDPGDDLSRTSDVHRAQQALRASRCRAARAPSATSTACSRRSPTKDGDAAGAGASARPRHVGRAAAARNRARSPPNSARFSARAQAKKIYWALVEGVPKPAQGRISMFLAKGEAMGDERGAKAAGPGRPRADAGRQARRPRRAAFADALRRGRQGRAAARLAVDAADHRPHPSVARPLRGDRPSDRRRPQIQPQARPTTPPAATRCAPCRRGSSPSCICSPAG